MNPSFNFDEMRTNIQNMMMNNMNDYKQNQTLSQMLQMIDCFTYNNPNIPSHNFNSIQEYYQIKNKDPLKDNGLSKAKKNLSLFFNCIYDFNKALNKIGTKIYTTNIETHIKYLAEIKSFDSEKVECRLIEEVPSTELPINITLYQGLKINCRLISMNFGI